MNTSKSKTLLFSLLLSYFLSGIFLLFLALALYRFEMPETQIAFAIYGVYGFSCFFGGILAGKKIGSQRFFWGIVVGFFYFMVLFFLSFLFENSTFPDMHNLIPILVCCLGGGMIGGMVS